MDTVYVLTVIWQMDSGDSGSTIKVFDTADKAITAMEKEIKSAKRDFEGMDTEDTIYCKGDMGYSIWEAGEYNFNHCDITVNECEVE